MTLIDSIDSILMLYSYTGFPEQRFRLFEPAQDNEAQEEEYSAYREAATSGAAGSSDEEKKEPMAVAEVDADTRIREIRKKAQRELIVKRNMMSGLSIVLTLMSIIVAFRCESYPARVACVRLFA
jgi:high-affinity nickel-transport protein